MSFEAITSITAAEEAAKAALAGAEASFGTQEGVNDLVIARYSFNKDFKTRYKENIQSISRKDMQEALHSLLDGGWAIYTGHGQ